MKKKASSKEHWLSRAAKKTLKHKPSMTDRVNALEARVSKIEAGISYVVQGAGEPEAGEQVRLEDQAAAKPE
jgi:hypothetical protein